MSDLPIILAVVGFCMLVIIIFNIFFVYRPILELDSQIVSLEAQISELLVKYEPQIKFVESLISDL